MSRRVCWPVLEKHNHARDHHTASPHRSFSCEPVEPNVGTARSTTPSAPVQPAPVQPAPKRGGSCAQIAAACKQAGFVPKGAKSGVGIVVDCIRPIMMGTPQGLPATKPLPQIDPRSWRRARSRIRTSEWAAGRKCSRADSQLPNRRAHSEVSSHGWGRRQRRPFFISRTRVDKRPLAGNPGELEPGAVETLGAWPMITHLCPRQTTAAGSGGRAFDSYQCKAFV